METSDLVELQQLMALYGHAADGTVDLDRVFTPDGIFDGRATGGAVHRGIEALRAFFGSPTHPHPPSHQTTNIYAFEDGDKVRVLSKWIVFDGVGGGPRSGDYQDVVVRNNWGEWRIAERIVACRFWSGPSAGPIELRSRL